MPGSITFLNLIRCVKCLEHLEYNDIYNKFVDILETKTNLSINELYGQIRDIKANEETNALEAVAFLNRFIDDNRTKMDIKERQNYLKIIKPLITTIMSNSDLSCREIYEKGDELIKNFN